MTEVRDRPWAVCADGLVVTVRLTPRGGRDLIDGHELQPPGVGTAGLVDELGLEPQQADPQQAASMGRVDRENGLVLVAELLRSFSEYLPPHRKSVLEETLSKGGELVLSDRAQGSEDAMQGVA